MHFPLRILVWLWCSAAAFVCPAMTDWLVPEPTVGAPYVAAIEAKCRQIEHNEDAIHSLRRVKIPEAERRWDQRIAELRAELAAIVKERDEVIADLLKGRFCSKCGRSKTELEKQGIGFEQHLGEVKGVPLPVSPEKLRAVREDYAKRIKTKSEQVAAAQKSRASELDALKQQVARLADACAELCAEIEQLNTLYGRNVLAMAQRQHLAWIDDLMRAVARMHVAEDVHAIARRRRSQIATWLRIEIDRQVDALRKQADAEMRRLREQMAIERKKMEELAAAHANARSVPDIARKDLMRALEQAERDLKKKDFSPEVKPLLEARRDDLRRELREKEAILAALDRAYLAKRDACVRGLAGLSAEIMNVSSRLFWAEVAVVRRLQNEAAQRTATADVKVAEAARRAEAATSAFRALVRDIEKKAFALSEAVRVETMRIVAAVRDRSCPLRSETQFAVAGHWNRHSPCVRAHTLPDSRATPAIRVNCTAGWEAYTSVYRPHFGALGPDDIELIRQNTYYDWFDRATQ